MAIPGGVHLEWHHSITACCTCNCPRMGSMPDTRSAHGHIRRHSSTTADMHNSLLRMHLHHLTKHFCICK